MSYTQSAILGVGTNYDGSKFSYPVKRYTKLFNSKFGRALLEQDNTDRGVVTRLYQADKDGNKVTLLKEKIDGLGDITKTRYSSKGEKLSSLRFSKNGTGEVSLLEHIGKDVKMSFYGHMKGHTLFDVAKLEIPAASKKTLGARIYKMALKCLLHK